METKVFKAGGFALLYVVFVTSFDSDQLRIKLLAGRGYSPMYVTGIVPPKRMKCVEKLLSKNSYRFEPPRS